MEWNGGKVTGELVAKYGQHLLVLMIFLFFLNKKWHQHFWSYHVINYSKTLKRGMWIDMWIEKKIKKKRPNKKLLRSVLLEFAVGWYDSTGWRMILLCFCQKNRDCEWFCSVFPVWFFLSFSFSFSFVLGWLEIGEEDGIWNWFFLQELEKEHWLLGQRRVKNLK